MASAISTRISKMYVVYSLPFHCQCQCLISIRIDVDFGYLCGSPPSPSTPEPRKQLPVRGQRIAPGRGWKAPRMWGSTQDLSLFGAWFGVVAQPTSLVADLASPSLLSVCGKGVDIPKQKVWTSMSFVETQKKK